MQSRAAPPAHSARRLRLLCVVAAAALPTATPFYLPGVAPKEYANADQVPLYVNKLTSTKTQLPYEYYSLPFCPPDEGIVTAGENLGELLRGDRITNSKYNLTMGQEVKCKVLCRSTITAEQLKQFASKIDDDYRVHMVIDNLPSATKYVDETDPQNPRIIYDLGFPLGFKGTAQTPGLKPGVAYLNNHVAFTIKYHRDASYEGSRIIGFEVEPYSVEHTYPKPWGDTTQLSTPCPITAQAVPLALTEGTTEVVYSYDVTWEYSPIKWASRWDTYLLMGDEQIHWFSIVNSLMIVLFLSGMVAMIMLRTLHADLNRYNASEPTDDVDDETGWKLVHGDVFRPPAAPMLLAVLVGTGVQALSMCIITMVFACLGFLSPANRGGLGTAMLLLFVFMGVPAGYSSAFLHKMLKGTDWKLNIILTATFLPGLIFLIFFLLNLFIWGEQSSAAVPFGTLFALIVLWFGISAPLVFLGAYLGYRRKALELPVRVNQIPRQVPEQVWYMKPAFSITIGGILPFGAVFIELFFILSSIWLHQFYYVFGFLLLVVLILIVTCAEITIVMCYFQLCAEDYHWWWRSFLTSGSSAVYLFIYSVFYFYTKLEITKFVPTILYFGYMLMSAIIFFVVTGTIGFYACHWFVWKIFSAIKVD